MIQENQKKKRLRWTDRKLVDAIIWSEILGPPRQKTVSKIEIEVTIHEKIVLEPPFIS